MEAEPGMTASWSWNIQHLIPLTHRIWLWKPETIYKKYRRSYFEIEYGLLIVIIIICTVEYIEIARLKSQVKNQQHQIDKICNATTNEQISANYISDELKQDVTELKRAGKDTEAVKLLRNATSMSLLEAKEYFDKL